MDILGIQYGSHDTSAALVRNGELIACIEQERFSGTKHTLDFPEQAVRYCLSEGRIELEQLDCIAYAGDPESRNPLGVAASSPFVLEFVGRQAFESELRRRLGRASDSVPLVSVPHHLCHAASAFLTSPYSEAAVFTIDGLGNWLSATGGKGSGTSIETLFQITHPHSLGFLYGAFTQFLGFRAVSGESKVMGLAAYGEPRYLDHLRTICRRVPRSIELDLDYFTFHRTAAMNPDGSCNLWYSNKFIEAFGKPRAAESEITPRDRDLAASVQALLEERCFELLGDLHEVTGSDSVCLAGGVALNSSMNGKISRQTPFRNSFIVPAANDGGLSLGAALQVAAERDESFLRRPLRHAFYGDSFSEKEIEVELSALPREVLVTRPADIVESTAALLHRLAVIGWFQGRMEIGPRALGHRSILANPADPNMKDRINRCVKHREDFRPFAPVVPLEHLGEFFDATEELPFMLKVVGVKAAKRDAIPAVTHVDGSARVQTITPEQDSLLHALLLAMGTRTGVPILLNTSFNIRGKTIVRTPKDAIACFLTTAIDALVLGPFLLEKKV